jgi:hypothetical protein
MVYFFLLRVVTNTLIGQPWLLHRMLIFCALNVSQQTVTSDTSQLGVLSLPEVNIMWGSFGWDEHIWRRIEKNNGILPQCDVFSVMATKKNIPDIFLMWDC